MMDTPSPWPFQRAQILISISQHRYRLLEQATTHHAHVWLALSEDNGNRVIIKSPLRDQEHEQQRAMRQLHTEVTILKGTLRGTVGIRQLLDQIDLTDPPLKQMQAGVFERLDTDLHEVHLAQKMPLSRVQIKSLSRQILQALSEIHSRNIVHTDLKPENIALSHIPYPTSEDLLVKLIDFGVGNSAHAFACVGRFIITYSASISGNDRRRLITNPYWRSPESWLGMPWGPAADIWSFGAIIGSLLMEPGAKLFQPMGGQAYLTPHEADMEFFRSVWTVVPFPPEFLERAPQQWQDELKTFKKRLAPTGEPMTLDFVADIFEIDDDDWAFVRDVLGVDPDLRPSADDLLMHEWLEE